MTCYLFVHLFSCSFSVHKAVIIICRALVKQKSILHTLHIRNKYQIINAQLAMLTMCTACVKCSG